MIPLQEVTYGFSRFGGAEPQRQKVVVVGNGMAGARLVEDIVRFHPHHLFDITIFGDEPVGGYNRILLSDVLNGSKDEQDIMLLAPGWEQQNKIVVRSGQRVTRIDRENRVVHTDKLAEMYDILVLATGSRSFVPPIPGVKLSGVFVFRTIDDCKNIAEYAQKSKAAVVLGGGLLGLEAAKGLLAYGVEVTVLEKGPWLMGAQLDSVGGQTLRKTIEGLGIKVRTNVSVQSLTGDQDLRAVQLDDETVIEADMAVIAAGIRPNIELALEAGLACERAILVDDELKTSDPHIRALGECVQHRGMVYGLVAPIWEQSKVLATQLTETNTSARYQGSKLATKLKVMGVDLVSLGMLSDIRSDDEILTFSEPDRHVYWKAAIRDHKLVAACLVGDSDPADRLMDHFLKDRPVPTRRLELFFGGPSSGANEFSLADMPDDRQICDCNGVCKGSIIQAIQSGKTTVKAVGESTRAGMGCGSCKKLVKSLIEAVNGEIKADPSESWYVAAVPMDKPTLVAEVKKRGLRSVSAVLRELGRGDDEKSKNGLASMLKSIWKSDYIDERDARYINDRVHANIQNNGTFSVVPRIFGGVITADELIKFGEVAKKYDVPMVKITGGQRIDLLGIKKSDLPNVWSDLGMPSGHAYTKAFRTCKTCVGSEFCRYGTNDSTSLGIEIEKKFQGFEFPAKVKMAVSGCPRNCAESTVKDVGVVATEGGDWEIIIGGAAGAHVRKADLLCRTKTREDAIKIIGRFLIYYRDNARWLERTYDFVPRIGVERIREIIVDDVLGIGSDLDADVEKTAASFVDPWLERDNPVFAGQFQDVSQVPVFA